MADERALKSNKSNYIQPNLGNYPNEMSFGSVKLEKAMDLRYGENPHQTSAFYKDTNTVGASIANAKLVHEGGKKVSAINILDANSALLIVSDMLDIHGKSAAVCVPVKHSTPSGVGIGSDLTDAYRLAKEGDPLAIFGCTMAVSRPVDMRFASEISDLLLECLVAPSFDADAKEYIVSKKKNIRLLETGSLENIAQMDMEIIPVIGGFVVQQPFYSRINSEANLESVSERKPTSDEYKALLTMWRLCSRVKSNSIVLGSANQVYGIGTGQMSRVASARIAIYNANEVFGKGGFNKSSGSVGASDAFFPFPDGPEMLAKAGMKAIVYPLGSEKDKETIEVWNKYNVAAVCTRPVPGTNEVERCFSGHR